MKHAVAALSFAFLTCLPGALAADELVIGLRSSSYSDDSARDRLFGSVEYRAAPFASRYGFDFSLGAIGMWDGEGDYFLGAGLYIRRPFGGDRWFVEFSETPGYYDNGDEDRDLGNSLEFHSQLALGYRFAPDWAGSVALSHISNAGTGMDNPGANFVSLRLHRSF